MDVWVYTFLGEIRHVDPTENLEWLVWMFPEEIYFYATLIQD